MKRREYGGYKSLAFYQQAEIIYDFTVEFCDLYINKRSRTHDQMVQAARSGKHPTRFSDRCTTAYSAVFAVRKSAGQGNIAEGYLEKSFKARIKLVGVARASLEELLNDYQDFLRQRRLEIWEKDSDEARKVRALVYNNYKNYNDYKNYMKSSEGAANAMICLINQTNQLFDAKLRWMEEKFVKDGGYTENLFKRRMNYRQREKKV